MLKLLLGLVAVTWGLAFAAPQDLSQDSSTESQPKIWALLVAGSNGYYNYRHQADVCHAYQILHRNGIPDKNIIVMMYDDIAHNSENPTPGIIINHPGGQDVYKGVPKDYTGEDVNPKNFLNVLTGNKGALKGIGSERVIESGPNDIVFVNFVDHGATGLLAFPSEELHARTLIKTISQMVSAKRFSKLILYVEACESGSMFDDLLPDDTNVFVVTAADPNESSYACYFDEERETYLGDVFSVVWMNNTESEGQPSQDLHHQFERVRTLTNTSHVEEYGDLDIGVTKLKEVLGPKIGHISLTSRAPPLMDVADNSQVPLLSLERRIQKEKDLRKKFNLIKERHELLKKRELIDHIFKEIIFNAAQPSFEKMSHLRSSHHGLNWGNIDCYTTLYETFKQSCMNIVQNSYVFTHLRKFVNMCSVDWLTPEQSIQAIQESCKKTTGLTKNLKGAV